ncbi:Protein SHORTAGE IN CHIASMATA 1 [Linum grandiflorum]
MRTRFLNIDYFSSPPAPPSSSPSVETLEIVELPVPTFSPPHLFTVEDYFNGLEDAPAVPLEIEKLHIETALSKFIAAVLPQVIDLDVPELEDFSAAELGTFVLGSDQIENCDGCLMGDKSTLGGEFILFEAPELDVFVGGRHPSVDGLQSLSEVSYIENNQDLPRSELKKQHLQKICESIYSEAEVSVEYDINQNIPDGHEDHGSIQMKNVSNHDLFPALEVNETNLRTFTDGYIERRFLSFLENVEILVPSNETEDFGSLKGDIFEVPMDHCLSKECLNSDMASLDSAFVLDNIIITEAGYCEEDCNAFPPAEPIIFHEPEFIGAHSSQLLESFFIMQKSCEPGISDMMIHKELNSRSFNELVVSSELALIDDSFRTLPVPILSDHDRTRSMHTILAGVLMELKERPLSTSDNIYLDWHFLDADICNCKISCHRLIVEDLDSHSTNLDMVSLDDGKPMLDFILSDDTLFKIEDHKESLDVLPESLHDSSSTCLGDKFPESGKLRPLDDDVHGKASKLFKSMSQFNDLEFFLNPGKATARERSRTAAEASNINPPIPEERVPHLGGNMSQQCLDPQLNSIPVVHKLEKASEEASYKVAKQSQYVPSATKSESTQGRKVSGPETVIVVNTQNFDKEMIVSRRSTYEKILAMEKEGTEVIERDMDLPVDVLINSAMCLAWYNCKSIRTQATTLVEASSCFRLCIDNIATQVLTLLSFTFKGCILVFEGESDFLSSVMESSDGLYAAAAGLGIDLQMFCSYSSELTDEIILSSVLHSTKECRIKCPEMPESESLGESFLTKFPSINPLTAHAILSSGGTLIDFLEWSHEHRILAVQQHHIPEESIALFSSLCKYGAREDSKSAMTDSISSVSTGADTDNRHLGLDSERKRRRYVHSPPKMEICMDDDWHFEPADNSSMKRDLPCVAMLQKDHWMPDVKDLLNELKQPISNLTDFLEQESNAATAVDFSSLPERFDTQHLRGAKEMDRTTTKGKSSLNGFFDQTQGSGMPVRKRLKKYNTSENENLHKDFKGVTIDLTCSPSPDKEVPSLTNSSRLSSWLCEEDQDFTAKPKAARKLSYHGNSMFTFPTASEINSEPDLWRSFKDHGRSSQDNHGSFDFNNNQEKVASEVRNKFLTEILVHRNAGTPVQFPMKEMPHYGAASLSVHSSQPAGSETPLSRAIHSSQPQTSSPWTIEFLNRIREKSRLRKLSFPNDASPTYPGATTDASKATKMKSPSLLDYFKYQGGRTPQKKPGPAKQKLPIRPSSASRVGASLSPIHTPIDRRAKQTLSFETNGSGSQTKLVWTDGGARPLSKKMRNF